MDKKEQIEKLVEAETIITAISGYYKNNEYALDLITACLPNVIDKKVFDQFNALNDKFAGDEDNVKQELQDAAKRLRELNEDNLLADYTSLFVVKLTNDLGLNKIN